MDPLRLDKFLKVSRIIKRRTVSNDACDGGRVLLNGRVAKAGASVKPGDIIEIRFGEKAYRYQILFAEEKDARAASSPMFEALT